MSTIKAVGYVVSYTLPIYRNTRLYKKITIKTAAGGVVDIQGWTILFTAKEMGNEDTDDTAAVIKVNTVIPGVDANGALGIFYLDIPDDSTDVTPNTYNCDLIYISGTERYPLVKFKCKVTDNVTKRESAI